MSKSQNKLINKDFKTILDFLRFGISQAEINQLHFGHGTDNAWDEMYSLLLDSLHLPLDSDPILLHARLTQAEKNLLSERLAKRLFAKIPVPYLTNKAYFCELPFYVDERVLIPRSPIAELIKQQFSPWLVAERVKSILDLCTGSGSLAIALSYAFPEAHIDAADISKDALAVAAINCKRHEVDQVVHLMHSDCFKAIPQRKYDLIVSNPPYVNAAEMKTLPEEYHHEPILALKAQKNGLAVVEKILKGAEAYLAQEGILVVEVGSSQPALEEAFPDLPFTWLEFTKGGEGVFLLSYQQLKAYFPKGGA